MNLRSIVMMLALALSACVAPDAPDNAPDTTWVGTITTEGSVTTVMNESGSVWGGTATLVENLSIGVNRGEEPYMFGWVISLWATDERIYVVDNQVPALRVYDRAGRYLRDIGRPGPGPGEYQDPGAVALLPDGRITVRENGPGQRINVYSPAGELVDTWYGEPSFGTDTPPVVTYLGEYFTQTIGASDSERQEQTMAMGRAGPDGIEGALLFFPSIEQPERLGLQVGRANFGIPFRPAWRSAMLPSGSMVAGVTSRYRLVVQRLDGRRLVVERLIAAIPVEAGEREWQRRRLIASARRFDPSFDWDGEEMAGEHPILAAIIPDRSRRIWVLRTARVVRAPDCTEDPLNETVDTVIPCYESEYVADVFDESSGKFLGEVELPNGVDLSPSFIQDDELYTTIEDDAGTIMVKRYRLVLPGER